MKSNESDMQNISLNVHLLVSGTVASDPENICLETSPIDFSDIFKENGRQSSPYYGMDQLEFLLIQSFF